MINDKQFEDAFTAAGGWFILTQFETVYNWKGEKSNLVDEIFKMGFDKNRTGTNTRVSSLIRIIDNNRGKEALEKIRDSKSINRIHPEAESMASYLLNLYYK
ncbi:MAG: hypothetical protein IKU87_03085 [Clostridia bacterium]|nr:hypothetical protein [Clostridia bacterium]